MWVNRLDESDTPGEDHHVIAVVHWPELEPFAVLRSRYVPRAGENLVLEDRDRRRTRRFEIVKVDHHAEQTAKSEDEAEQTFRATHVTIHVTDAKPHPRRDA
jgi:hypothetical protein